MHLIKTWFYGRTFFFVFSFQVSIVGDFSEEDIESCILDYLGTVRATKDSKGERQYAPVVFRPSPSHLQSQQVRVDAI